MSSADSPFLECRLSIPECRLPTKESELQKIIDDLLLLATAAGFALTPTNLLLAFLLTSAALYFGFCSRPCIERTEDSKSYCDRRRRDLESPFVLQSDSTALYFGAALRRENRRLRHPRLPSLASPARDQRPRGLVSACGTELGFPSLTCRSLPHLEVVGVSRVPVSQGYEPKQSRKWCPSNGNPVCRDLSNNQFGGSIPYSVSHMAKLELLNLAHNQLCGRLDDIFQGLSKLTTMDLSYNSLNGTVPQSFRSLTSLTNLYLENNQFTGTINALANLTLQSLNVANNHFNGSIPNRLKGINNLQIDNNEWSSGTDSSSQPNQSPSAQNSNTGHGSSVRVGGIAGGVAGVFFIEKEMNRTSSIFDIEKLPSLPPPSLKPHHYKSFDKDDCSSKLITKKVDVTSIKSTIYSVADLQIATDSFSEDNLIREGTFVRVFKAEFDDGKILAVKKLNPKSLLSKSTGDFIDLVTNISLLHHTNLTELVGYCSEYGQRMLVYDFHKNGSLYELLHLSDEPLSWNARIKIALGAARALE
ncbi:hypothetical protein ZIOFF_071188 [Zingiber officinale]|uniref:Protein kinase domain-containing protein n=1 Tax=Zingiber officinale TaxID=94328 RepID=A0A8J5ETG0_ZINOF|nr:hypothetical protein ZIOFF_071188 [Zingiber officinale]